MARMRVSLSPELLEVVAQLGLESEDAFGRAEVHLQLSAQLGRGHPRQRDFGTGGPVDLSESGLSQRSRSTSSTSSVTPSESSSSCSPLPAVRLFQALPALLTTSSRSAS